MKLYVIMWLTLMAVFSQLQGCSSITKPVEDEVVRVWPEPPQPARLRYSKTITTAEDLGIRKGFFSRIADLLTGEQETRIVRPMAVVTDSAGRLYVADPGMQGVHRFDTKNSRYSLLRLEDGKPLPSPVGLSRGSNGSVWLTDSQLSQVFMLENNSDVFKPMKLDAQIGQATGIAYDFPTERLFIADTANHRILVFNHDGSLFRSFGQRGSSAGQFNFPTYLWVNSKGQLLVTDSLNFRVQIFDLNGRYLRSFGHLGDASGNFSRPKGVTTDTDGHVYVVDGMFHAMQIFNDNGELLLPVGSQGSAPGEFWLPTGVFCDENDLVYVADSHNRRVQVFEYLRSVK